MPLIYNWWRWSKNKINWSVSAPEEQAQSAMDADVVVFQRPDDIKKLEAAKLLKEMWKIIIFENDDTYHVDIEHKFKDILTEKIDILNEFIKISHGVTTTTETLKKEYLQYNDNVYVIPNYVDPLDWDEPIKNETWKIRVWLVWSVTTNWDFKEAAESIKRLSENKDVQLVMFWLPPTKANQRIKKLYKDDYDFWSKLDIEWQPLVEMENYFETLRNLRLDIMMIPRKNDYFNKCKSNIKFLEASMLSIPCVCQSFEDWPYENVIEDWVNWLMVKDNNDWYDKVISLVNNKELREKIWYNANKFVLDNYNINDNYNEWDKVYREIAQKNNIKL